MQGGRATPPRGDGPAWAVRGGRRPVPQFPHLQIRGGSGRGIPALLPLQVLSSPGVPAGRPGVHHWGALWGRPGVGVGGGSTWQREAWLTSAGSVSRRLDRLRAGPANGLEPGARWSGPRPEASRAPGGAREGPWLPTARLFTRPLAHSPRTAGRRPFPRLVRPRPGRARAPSTHRPSIYLGRPAPAQPNLLPGPAPTCPASEALEGAVESGGGGRNRGPNQSQPAVHSCARSDWVS